MDNWSKNGKYTEEDKQVKIREVESCLAFARAMGEDC